MKKIFTTLFALAYVAFSFAQSIPDSTFESWTSGKPTGWDATNISMGLSVVTVTQETTNPQSGTSSCKMETKSLLGTTVPGLITLGTIHIGNPSTITGGIPFHYIPTKLKGYYKGTPATGDQGFIGVGLSKVIGGVRDTIGQGYQYFPTAAAVWTPFEVDITWASSDVPDSLNIIISSSDPTPTGNPVVGSLFWVDSLYFEYSLVGINESSKPMFEVSHCYPNPFSNETTVNFTSPDNSVYDFSVMNMIGVEVYKTQINAKTGQNNFRFSAADLPSGIYMFNIKNGLHNQTKSMIISK